MGDAEENRIEALRSLDIMGSLPDSDFDRLIGLAGHVAAADYAHICFVDGSIRWIKAATSWACQPLTPRERTICSDVVASGATIIVQDLANHPNPIYRQVHGALKFKAYAGLPIKTHDGHTLGALAVMSRGTLSLDETRLAALRDLSFLANRETLLKKTVAGKGRRVDGSAGADGLLSNSVIDDHVAVLRAANDGVIVVRNDGLIAFVNAAAEKLLGCSKSSLLQKPVTTLEATHEGRPTVVGTALQESLTKGAERYVRAATLQAAGSPVVAIDCLITPMIAADSAGAVLIFRKAASGTASNGIDLRATLREVTRLKQQVARLDRPPAPLRIPQMGDGPFAIDDLLDLIRSHERDQIVRAKQVCGREVEGPRGAGALLGLRSQTLRLAPVDEDDDRSKHRSRVERWRDPTTQDCALA